MTDRLRIALAPVRWIGSPPDGGKSTVAELLAERHQLPVYHLDRHERDHLARADPAWHPKLARLARTLAETDELEWVERHWIASSPEEMARWTITCWIERCDLVAEDLLARPEQAVFLILTQPFKRASHARCGKSTDRPRARATRHATSTTTPRATC